MDLGYTQKESQRLISKGRVFQNNKPITKTGAIIEGEFELVEFEPATRGLEPTFQTDDFVVFDKPSGVLIHPQNRHTKYSLVDELKYQFGKDANITHRIDQETSGLVLCAKNKKSERDIKMMFENREITKTYLAMVHGHLKDAFISNEPLLRAEDESAIVRMIVKVDEKGKVSKTSFKPLKYFKKLNMTLVECKPHTGRQHQIRVHLFHMKHPIVGDPIYGQKDEDIIKFLDKDITTEERIKKSGSPRLLLHANQLFFKLYDQEYTIQSNVNFVEKSLKLLSECE